jgi:hypothetical protein
LLPDSGNIREQIRRDFVDGLGKGQVVSEANQKKNGKPNSMDHFILLKNKNFTNGSKNNQ